MLSIWNPFVVIVDPGLDQSGMILLQWISIALVYGLIHLVASIFLSKWTTHMHVVGIGNKSEPADEMFHGFL